MSETMSTIDDFQEQDPPLTKSELDQLDYQETWSKWVDQDRTAEQDWSTQDLSIDRPLNGKEYALVQAVQNEIEGSSDVVSKHAGQQLVDHLLEFDVEDGPVDQTLVRVDGDEYISVYCVLTLLTQIQETTIA